ncbi:MAG: DEAD/DEAH box helicase [Acidobacteriota bacterium]
MPARPLPRRVEAQLQQLIERSAAAISEADRRRGDSLVAQGRVAIFGGVVDSKRVHSLESSLEIMVSSDGVDDHFVTLEVPSSGAAQGETRGKAELRCDCRRFARAGSCAHLWAACRAVEMRLEALADGGGRASGAWRRLFASESPVPGHDAHPRVRRSPAPTGTLFVALEPFPDRNQRRRLAVFWPGETMLLLRFVESPAGTSDASGKLPVRPRALSRRSLGVVEPAELRALAAALLAFAAGAPVGSDAGPGRGVERIALPSALWPTLVPPLAALGRLGRLDATERTLHPLRWDDGAPWRLGLDVGRRDDDGARLGGRLERRGPDGALEHRSAEEVVAAFPAAAGPGLLCFGESLARLEAHDASWVDELRHGPLDVAPGDVLEFLEQVHERPHRPQLALPEAWRWPEVHEAPTGLLRVTGGMHRGRLEMEIRLLYGEHEVAPHDPRPRLVDPGGGRVLVRDRAAEERLEAAVEELGVARDPTLLDRASGSVPAAELAAVLDAAFDAGWRVEVEGARVERGVEQLSLRTAIDWFDLEGVVSFGERTVALPELLRLLQDGGGTTIDLGDERRGYLAPAVRRRLEALVALALEGSDSALRFHPAQALLLDALLDARSLEVDADARFERLRRAATHRGRVEPVDPPASFRGTLRDYQRQGVGWMQWLGSLGLGGCLADDMGLGKTVQLLALLETHRVARHATDSTALIVVPRTLLDTWRSEAARFTPELRVGVYHGARRRALLERLDDIDLVLTTYGTLRRDAARLAEVRWHTVVLDEAQAIKNPGSQTAKAARLLPASQRLALTGTPVENHLGDLWSLFEFLNPGLLGRLPALAGAVGKTELAAEALEVIARALRPLILRRSKSQVLEDLPPKQEVTLRCELGSAERRRYDELRDHYRQALRPSLDGARGARVTGSKILVLEALLRLRQAAIHPGLVLGRTTRAQSAKIGLLFDQLEQVVAEGHKALVFSQFVRLLDILEHEIERRGWRHVRLDGRTRDRQRRVDRFQDDPEIPLFLISLKAGGVGLNLTAASYVFLLDPWWNPAIESQAIDRAHRIGQQAPVTAYRLVARDTVEEKILELQERKRELADAIVARDESLLRALTIDDLELLLG